MGNRGAFYETAGCLRDVIEKHLFQVVALLAMEPPAGRDFGAVHTEKAKETSVISIRISIAVILVSALESWQYFQICMDCTMRRDHVCS